MRLVTNGLRFLKIILMSQITSREIRLASRPNGIPTAQQTLSQRRWN